jgi:ornithine cyclodeaminase/alanine dehydrogenase-like protein (mu-crystallin family)
MKNDIIIKIITQCDLLDAGCFNIPESITVVEEALRKHVAGQIVFPDKVSVIFNEESQNRINCLPAGILDENVYGMKWVSVFPNNPHLYGMQNVSAVTLLSELTHGFPIAFMEGTLCSNLRTAAISAVAAKYLANPTAQIIGFIGAGEQAKTHLMAMLAILPSLKCCKVASRTSESEQKFIEQMSVFYPDIEFESCNADYKRAVVHSDIIITAISGQEKILKADWIKHGALYCHVGGLEDDFAVPCKASKIVCDDWSIVKHRTQTISRMYKMGLLDDSNIYANLEDIVAGTKEGRTSANEFIYFNTVGLSYIDVMMANYMYKKVVNAGLGHDVAFQSISMFDVIPDRVVLK